MLSSPHPRPIHSILLFLTLHKSIIPPFLFICDYSVNLYVRFILPSSQECNGSVPCNVCMLVFPSLLKCGCNLLPLPSPLPSPVSTGVYFFSNLSFFFHLRISLIVYSIICHLFVMHLITYSCGYLFSYSIVKRI